MGSSRNEMSDQVARQDPNQFPAMIAHTGTAGTAETVRVVADESGALSVNVVAGDSINIGTLTLGTISMLNAGTITRVGTAIGMGTLTNVGKVYNAGTIQNMLAGTISTVLNAGTIQNILGGTIANVLNAGTIQNQLGGTIDTLKSGTVSGTVGILGYRSSDASFQPLRLDKATNSIQTVSYEHHEIHSGSHFFVRGVQDLSINQVLDFTWLMPNTTSWVHWIWKMDTENETAWYVYEGGTATNALANAITPLNSNRNSSGTSTTTMKYEVQANLTAADADTNVSGATLLMSGISGSGRNTGEERRENEIILKQGSLYCLRAVATAAGYIDFDMQWYEHTDIA